MPIASRVTKLLALVEDHGLRDLREAVRPPRELVVVEDVDVRRRLPDERHRRPERVRDAMLFPTEARLVVLHIVERPRDHDVRAELRRELRDLPLPLGGEVRHRHDHGGESPRIGERADRRDGLPDTEIVRDQESSRTKEEVGGEALVLTRGNRELELGRRVPLPKHLLHVLLELLVLRRTLLEVRAILL